ncbi:hypothetical protein GEMRC1_001121 [Eukaryota sp. GEM-RC1]
MSTSQDSIFSLNEPSPNPIRWISFNDSSMFFSAAASTLSVWDTEQLTLACNFPLPFIVSSAAIPPSPASVVLTYGDSSHLVTIDLRSATLSSSLSIKSPTSDNNVYVTYAKFIDESSVLVADTSSKLYVVDLVANKVLFYLNVFGGPSLRPVAFSKSKSLIKSITIGNGLIVCHQNDGQLLVWNLYNFFFVGLKDYIQGLDNSGILDYYFSDILNFGVMVVSQGNSILFLDKDLEISSVSIGHVGNVSCLSCASDFVVSGDDSGSLLLWKI